LIEYDQGTMAIPAQRGYRPIRGFNPNPFHPGGTSYGYRIPAPAKPAYRTVTTPGYKPNYAKLLAGFPGVVDAQGAYGEAVGSSEDQRRNAIRAAIIQLGAMPGGVGPGLTGIDPQTGHPLRESGGGPSWLQGMDANLAGIAAGNSASALSQLGVQRSHGRADLGAELASRGILNSGALTGGEHQIQQNYDKGVAQATQETMAAIQGALGAETTAKAQARAALGTARMGAATSLMQDPRYRPTAPTRKKMRVVPKRLRRVGP
jgi:hypothetical protein